MMQKKSFFGWTIAPPSAKIFLFTMLLTAVNSICAAPKIALKHLVVDNTFMSADRVDHAIEKMKRKKNIYDWDDFLAMAKHSSSGNVTVYDMKAVQPGS
ncbi:MAG: hypothetical protein GY816_12400 [Cytophagales bacterium]|nr:hypothetical protein [Cytophagales bacterium]